jgi:gliding motility-associated-like protein
MKYIILIFFGLLFLQNGYGNHTKGGYMYYEYVGPGSAPNTARYNIVLKLYTNCFLNNGQFDLNINFSIFNAGTNQLESNNGVSYSDSVNIENCTLPSCHPCIVPIPFICYKIITYRLTKDLPIISAGYVVSYQRCCRIAGINNIQAPSNNIGETWTVSIPGAGVAPNAEQNSSARFAQNDTAIICEGANFTFDFSAFDPNGDSLVYEFCDAFSGASSNNASPTVSSAPPYSSVPYSSGFSGGFPMGSGVSINRFTGIVSGIAPNSGVYVLTCCVSEYRRGTGIRVGQSRKSLHIQVANCNLTEAKLNPEYISCDGFTLTFSNNSNSGDIQTWFWDLGVPGDPNSISTSPVVTYTYPDTGVYVIKLVVNRGLACSDSATARVRVFPGFFPDFRVAGQCRNTPVQFTDLTATNYGVVDRWRWDFGNPAVLSDTARVRNPTYTYPNSGDYNVRLIVGNSKGCEDTVIKPVTIVDRATFDHTNDTLICIIDTLQLNAVGNGTFLWSPNYMISDVNSPSPLVSPDVPTTYYITFTDPFGCTGNDSVRINVKAFVTLDAGNDTTICQTDNIILRPNTDGLQFQWSPPTGLSSTTVKNPVARPLNDIRYRVVAAIGKCNATDSVAIRVVPYPTLIAGKDTAICTGGTAQLFARGASRYTWLPTAYLDNNTSATPRSIQPPATINYVVFARDTLGCPKPSTDTITVVVFPPIAADAGPRDTTIVLGEPLLLNASGGTNYVWAPADFLTNAGVRNPVALPSNTIEYIVTVSNDAGCSANDTILVKLFFVEPGFYVPNAFTPNGDGRNDVFRPILLGMKSLDRFMIYNRWGQLLFSTTNIGQGWDGRFGGKGQETATYVWIADGTDYKNRKIRKKGTFVLIR